MFLVQQSLSCDQTTAANNVIFEVEEKANNETEHCSPSPVPSDTCVGSEVCQSSFTTGYSNWKKALEKFKIHSLSITLREAVIKWKQLQQPSIKLIEGLMHRQEIIRYVVDKMLYLNN